MPGERKIFLSGFKKWTKKIQWTNTIFEQLSKKEQKKFIFDRFIFYRRT